MLLCKLIKKDYFVKTLLILKNGDDTRKLEMHAVC